MSSKTPKHKAAQRHPKPVQREDKRDNKPEYTRAAREVKADVIGPVALARLVDQKIREAK